MFAFITTSSIITIFCAIWFSNKKRNKFKYAVYNIGACPGKKSLQYYFMVEMAHGQYYDARKLSKNDLLFIPEVVIPSLKNTYTDYKSAEKSLEEFKNKYLCA